MQINLIFLLLLNSTHLRQGPAYSKTAILYPKIYKIDLIFTSALFAPETHLRREL